MDHESSLAHTREPPAQSPDHSVELAKLLLAVFHAVETASGIKKGSVHLNKHNKIHAVLKCYMFLKSIK